MPESWATIEDFATLFQYFWYRDFPIDNIAIGAKRTDWTIHIGVVVRNVADLMGYVTRFEAGSRKDAVLRSTKGDEIAVEWEWGGVWGKANELKKLKEHEPWKSGTLKYAVLITYTPTPNIDGVCQHVLGKWAGAKWPLLLILIDLEKSSEFTAGKRFNNVQMSLFDNNIHKPLRRAPAFPWKVDGTRWSYNFTK